MGRQPSTHDKLLQCAACPRLAAHLAEVRRRHPDYHARPVLPFGDENPKLLIVGLAPGLHGANATGRPFTGDYAGILLYETLFEFGFSNQAEATSASDGLRLSNCRITNAVKCLPPENKPTGAEVRQCNHYLASEVEQLGAGTVILALGTVAHGAVIRALGARLSSYAFKHGAEHQLPGERVLVDSYHCSRYNTQTKRLTADMFRAVFRKIVTLMQ
jgi:uracil-DNA glycosylase family 4